MIDVENAFVISDTHFGHHNIIRFCNRPADHEMIMVNEWNRVVPEDGVVLHLGDLAYRGEDYFKTSIAPFLHGRDLKLVQGNHDNRTAAYYESCGFSMVPADEFWWMGKRISYSHYPEDVVPDSRIHLHGHIHNNGYAGKDNPYQPFRRNQVNLSVEQTGYAPVPMKPLLEGLI